MFRSLSVRSLYGVDLVLELLLPPRHVAGPAGLGPPHQPLPPREGAVLGHGAGHGVLLCLHHLCTGTLDLLLRGSLERLFFTGVLHSARDLLRCVLRPVQQLPPGSHDAVVCLRDPCLARLRLGLIPLDRGHGALDGLLSGPRGHSPLQVVPPGPLVLGPDRGRLLLGLPGPREGGRLALQLRPLAQVFCGAGAGLRVLELHLVRLGHFLSSRLGAGTCSISVFGSSQRFLALVEVLPGREVPGELRPGAGGLVGRADGLGLGG
mmetsp:Transcript_42107/g.100648  ORF Transcript_42107/g.100648 Transcript_42107/m.100648 type:complete len:264 (-) Transcript_42107:389-1180(-)